jgi:hypothetical protein
MLAGASYLAMSPYFVICDWRRNEAAFTNTRRTGRDTQALSGVLKGLLDTSVR